MNAMHVSKNSPGAQSRRRCWRRSRCDSMIGQYDYGCDEGMSIRLCQHGQWLLEVEQDVSHSASDTQRAVEYNGSFLVF